ncbi:MAG: hypothetical protein ACD_28C00011G0017 [uncultured bacterium]|nr:MAG: hypothetical protein ACD_28C00011G0017 [uncultured bacterium]
MKSLNLFTNREFLDELNKILSRFDAQMDKVKHLIVGEKKNAQQQKREMDEKKFQDDPEQILSGLKSL